MPTQEGAIKVLYTTATVDFGSTNAQKSTDSSDITLTGAALGDPVWLGSSVSGAPPIDSSYAVYVKAADTVVVRYLNLSAGALDPASQTFTICVAN